LAEEPKDPEKIRANASHGDAPTINKMTALRANATRMAEDRRNHSMALVSERITL
jgi:uncharacterized protein HemY